ncbi:SDR family oxidoreductase [Mesorhizobium sp. IMUNJ 23033]|uniref:SDR family oxidoreductase n=1 Tax=Mesorhizobium sp. IMUNJ 23033 TaxID=3378039 RepID=UPI00384D5F8F
MDQTSQATAFAGKVALVTGAARGIGLAIATRLLNAGAEVVLADLSESDLNASVSTLSSNCSGRALAVRVDVSKDADVTRMVEAAAARFGRVDILVNNAGISPKHGGRKATVEEMLAAEWRQVLEVNLTGAFLCCRACLPHMRAAKWGRIINIASVAGRTKTEIAGAHYAASKAGMMALARTLAVEVGSMNITVNSIAPGRIETPMAAAAGAELNQAYVARIPVGRLGTGEDIAAAVAYLASKDAAFLTGVTLDVNGGSFMI